jgi:hypothetical protein
MTDRLTALVPEPWKSLVEFVLLPLSWIPDMQQSLLSFVLTSSTGWTAAAYVLFLLLPVLLWVSAVWCTQLSLYTLPFRSGRIDFVKLMLLAWWDAALAVWMYWVGLGRFVAVIAGWVFTLARLAIRLVVETVRQVVMLPFTMTGRMTQSYFQPGVPWIAFLLLIFWCLLEAVIFTYTLLPTVSEVLAGLVGAATPQYTGTVLFIFLFLLIMGSFACLQTLSDAIRDHQYKFLVQMIIIEVFVMTFEVMFLYRELVDAITPWIAQQTGERFRPGLGFTLSLATFGWIGVRGMTWFLFGQYGTPPLAAFMARRPLVQPGAEGERRLAPAEAPWWKAPVEDFKREVGWLHEKGHEMMEYLMLPVLHVTAAALNFAMILVATRPVFSVPFKSLKEVLEAREMLPTIRLQPKKVAS